jgi:tetratricopeptide (TPR) repeat protein
VQIDSTLPSTSHPLAHALGDRYLIERELGRGGMATVYLAQDRQHGRKVAVKLLRRELSATIGPERFLREIAITAQLDHPHILPLLDSGKAGPDALLYYVMPLVDGESLRERLARDKQLGVAEAVQVAREVADALAYAHARGVIHRDIKPENILLSNGHARVADFGIARAVVTSETQHLTETGIAIGTPAYMSPEQAAGDAGTDVRTDVYAVGCVLYEMLAGRPPFMAPTPQAILAKVLTSEPEPLDVLRPGIPQGVQAAVRRATARDPADRFQTAAELARQLARPGEPDSATRELAPLRGPGSGLRNAIVAGLVLMGLVVGALLWRDVTKAPAAEPPSHVPSAEAVALYQRGVHGYDRRTNAGIVEAISAFSAAIALDSSYSRAWSGLAKAYYRAQQRQFSVRGMSWDSILRLAIQAADQALVRDSNSADAWLAQSQVSRGIDPTDAAPAIRAARRALALDSTSAPAWHELAIATADQGDMLKAAEYWRRSVAADPRYTQGLGFLASAHYWLRAYDSAAIWIDSTVAVDPTYIFGRSNSGYIAIQQGDFVRAAAAFDAARRLGTDVEALNARMGRALTDAESGDRAAALAELRATEDTVSRMVPPPLHTIVYRAHVYAALGDARGSVQVLARYQPRRDLHFQMHLACDPPFDAIANDPGFRALLIRTK